MHELRRRAYLEAIGIANYVSREPLPGAAPSRKLVILRKTEVGQSAAPQLLEGATLEVRAEASVKPQIPRVEITSTERGAASTSPNSKVPDATVENVAAGKFSIVAMMLGKWLWLEELPVEEALLRDQGQLVQAMSHALGWGSDKPDISQFNWPIHTNNQLDLGEEAARASLGGFVSRKLSEKECRGVVLLGSGSQKWVPREPLGSWKCIATVSTIEMLQNPLLKKQAWQELRPFAESV